MFVAEFCCLADINRLIWGCLKELGSISCNIETKGILEFIEGMLTSGFLRHFEAPSGNKDNNSNGRFASFTLN